VVHLQAENLQVHHKLKEYDKALEELRRALKFQEDLQGSALDDLALDDLASAAVARAQCASGK
jgi:hypothetical protein